MATDLVTTRTINHKAPAGHSAGTGMALFRRLMDDVRTRPGKDKIFDKAACGTLDESADVKTLLQELEYQTLEQDGWKRSMSATVALLRHAHEMIASAEDMILAQSRRIEQLEIVATTDELTALRNRRGFYDAFMAELDRCNRGISKGGLLVLIDLDNFKSINDTYGHAAGDACLRLAARTLDSEIRLMDTAARLGGDEFVLLLSNTTQKEAAGRAQQLAWRLNNLALAWYGDTIPVQASVGLKGYKKGDRPENVFNAADMKLYACKRQRHQEREAAPSP